MNIYFDFIYIIKQSVFNMDELKRNVKGFTALSKHLVRGSFGGKDTALLTPSARSLSNNAAKQ